MNLLHSIAAIVERLPRSAATGAAASWPSDPTGAYRPFARSFITA